MSFSGEGPNVGQPIWYVQIPGKTLGPMPTEAVVQMFSQGTINVTTPVWRQGMADWARIYCVPEFGGTPAPPLPDDQGPFLKVGSTFYVNGEECVGRIIASPDAMYMIRTRRLNALRIHHNLAISAVSTVLHALRKRDEEVRTCTCGELPVMVRTELDPKGKRSTTAVVVVRRGSLEFVDVPRIYNVITLRTESQRVGVVTSWFGVRKVGRWLQSHGWTVNQRLQPVEAAMHGPGFVRGDLG